MELQSLNVTTRNTRGKGPAGQIRAKGVVPAVLYGGDGDSVCLTVDARRFEQLLHRGHGGEHAIVQLEIEDQPALSTPALIKDVQHHPIRGQVLHADFMRIRLDVAIQTVVPVRLVGQAPGITEGGVLDFQLRSIEVECLALDVPDEFVVDVSGLHINESVHVAQVQIPERVTVLTDPDRPVAAVLAPRTVKEEGAEGAEGAEGESKEPEVITEKKEKAEEKDSKEKKK